MPLKPAPIQNKIVEPSGITPIVWIRWFNNLRNKITELEELLVGNNRYTAFGELQVAELSPVFQYTFEYTVDNTELTTNTVTNGGTVTQANAMAVINSSTTTDSSACLQSKRQAKYRSGLGALARFTTLFETGGVANTFQLAGMVDEIGSQTEFKNGYTIGFDGETFGFHRFANDVISSVNQSDWDDPLDGSGASRMTLDTSKLNVWEIRFQYLGGGGIELWVESSSTGNFVLAHKVLYANLNTVPSNFMPNFHITMYVNNKGTTTDLVLKTGSFSYFIEGKTELIQTHQPHFTTGVRSKASVTTEIALFTIRNKSTYASKTNFIELVLENVFASVQASSANNLAELRFVRNATLGGTPSYTDISTTDSIVDIDTAGTTVTGGDTLFSVALAGKNDRESENLVSYKLILEPGETITISATSANTATIKAGLLWKELF